MNTPQSESVLQAQIVQWLRWSLPASAFLTAFPAGGGGRVRGAKLKRMGLVPGFPDLLLIWNGEAYGLEVKTAKGRVSQEQVDCHMQLAKAGMSVVIIRSVAEAERTCLQLRIPLRARIAA